MYARVQDPLFSEVRGRPGIPCLSEGRDRVGGGDRAHDHGDDRVHGYGGDHDTVPGDGHGDTRSREADGDHGS